MNRYIKSKYGIDEKVASFILISSPLTEPYRIYGISMFVVVMLLCIFYLCIKKKKGNQLFILPKDSILFYLYCFSIPILCSNVYDYANNYSGYISTIGFYILASGFLLPRIKLPLLIKYLGIVAIATSIVFILQELLFYFRGERFSGLLPFLELKYDTVSMKEMIHNQMTQGRSCSLFLEPSHFAEFIVVAFCIELWKNHSKSIFFSKKAILFSLVLLLLRSGTGLILCSFCWLYLYLHNNSKNSTKIIYTIVFVILIIFLPIIIENSSIGQELLARSNEISLDKEINTSGTKRLFRGLWVFLDLPQACKIFGVTTDGLVTAIENSQASFLFIDGAYFVNNIQTLLISVGIIGVLLFVLYNYKLYKKCGFLGRIVILTFILLCFIESFLFTPKMLLYMCIAECSKSKFGFRPQSVIN